MKFSTRFIINGIVSCIASFIFLKFDIYPGQGIVWPFFGNLLGVVFGTITGGLVGSIAGLIAKMFPFMNRWDTFTSPMGFFKTFILEPLISAVIGAFVGIVIAAGILKLPM